MIRYDLKGKTAMVTGAASGIGFATASDPGAAGAAVALNFLHGRPSRPSCTFVS